LPAGLPGFVEDYILGKTISKLGVSAPVNFAQTGVFIPIFTADDIRIISPDFGYTFVHLLGISTPGAPGTWMVGSSPNSNDWASGTSYSTGVEVRGQPQFGTEVYTPGDIFGATLLVPGSGTGVLTAYGYAI
jgi:hypothetical protein